MRFGRMACVAGVAIALGVFIVSGCQSLLEDNAGPVSTTLPANLKPVTLYDSDPNHLWNRLHSALFIRTGPDGQQYGQDQLDPLLWLYSRYLITEPSHHQAITVLDEFLAKHGEMLINDPLKKAILQRDLWAVFDWSTQNDWVNFFTARRELQTRLAAAIDRLALSADQIAKLPDNYAAAVASRTYATEYDDAHPDAPFLPPDIFQPDGPWVSLSIPNNGAVAISHVQKFGGRSTFLIFLRLPAGRQATLDYLAKLSAFPAPWIYGTDSSSPGKVSVTTNPGIPQFPAGTEVALVRQANLIDENGQLRSTHLTESVQIRVYRTVVDTVKLQSLQSVFEFKLSRRQLFTGDAGGLRAVGNNEVDFDSPMEAFPYDPFKEDPLRISRYQHVVLHSCLACHRGEVMHSFLSYRPPHPGTFQASVFEGDQHGLSIEQEQAQQARGFKSGQYSWGLLRGMMGK